MKMTIPYRLLVGATLTVSAITGLPDRSNAQNPISPMGVYIADPSARLDKNGAMYVYGSLDENPAWYCSKSYHVLSSTDLQNWTLHPHSFHNDDVLFAPDVMEKSGIYYLYYDIPSGEEFVAVSESPTGPYRDGQLIKGPNQIDPNIFIDDDGQVYYFWGQFSAKGAKMNDDMKTLDLSTYVDGLVTEKDHFFHEGSFVFKRGKYYYYTFADISRNGRPTCIGYAMGTSPLGPYEYKGVIIDNAGCDPETWNNHGSVVQYGDKWYVFYHRSTHGSRAMRKACIEPITFNADGTIPEVEMTTQGAAGPLNPYQRTDAARACLLKGHARIRQMAGEDQREMLSGIQTGDMAAWKYFNFNSGRGCFSVRAKATKECQLTVHADNPDGRILCKINIPAGDDWNVLKAEYDDIQGIHAVWMTFEGVLPCCDEAQQLPDNGGQSCIDWFSFAPLQ